MVAIDDQARLWGWGYFSSSEQLISSPTILRTDVSVVLAGCRHLFVRTLDNQVLAYGSNLFGQVAGGTIDQHVHWIPSQMTVDMIRVAGAPMKKGPSLHVLARNDQSEWDRLAV